MAMRPLRSGLTTIMALQVAISCAGLKSFAASKHDSKATGTVAAEEMLSKFERLSSEPILKPREGKFDDTGAFNPTAARLDDGKIILLYRGQDKKGISRVGYAESTDGIHFKANDQPVLAPAGEIDLDGVEDPRLCRDPLDPETWFLTATAYSKSADTAQLVAYRSRSLAANSWKQAGIVVPSGKGKWNVHWTKSGAMVTDDEGRPLKIKGKYWMYYLGDGKNGGHDQMGLVCSEDGRHWSDATDSPVLLRRPGMFDSNVVEPGPHTIVTRHGILLIYNGADAKLAYRTGWALFDKNNPAKLLARSQTPVFEPETGWEKKNSSKEIYQAPNVVFVEGIVPEGKGSYLIYYGCADSYTGVARTKLAADEQVLSK